MRKMNVKNLRWRSKKYRLCSDKLRPQKSSSPRRTGPTSGSNGIKSFSSHSSSHGLIPPGFLRLPRLGHQSTARPTISAGPPLQIATEGSAGGTFMPICMYCGVPIQDTQKDTCPNCEKLAELISRKLQRGELCRPDYSAKIGASGGT